MHFTNNTVVVLSEDGSTLDPLRTSQSLLPGTDEFDATAIASALREAVYAYKSQRADVAENDQVVTNLQERIAGMNVTIARLEALALEHEEWKQKLTADAHAYADSQDWCPIFDDFMVDHGLEPRRRDWTICAEVTYTTSFTVSAGSEDEARRLGYDTLQDSARFPSTVRLGGGDLQERGSEITDVEAD